MANEKQLDKAHKSIHLGTFDFAGRRSGTYCGGVAKLRIERREDLLASAQSFLEAADRCLNGCSIENGVSMLTVPGTVCASFSCELSLKYILLVETGDLTKGHDLAELFRQCSPKAQSALAGYRRDIAEILERNKTQYVDARYHHEEAMISFRPQELLQTAEVLWRFVEERCKREPT